MSPALVRALVFGSRKSCLRLVAITLGIAIGMAGFLLLAGAFVGLQSRDARDAWLDATGPAAEPTDFAALPADAVLALRTDDHFHGRRVDVLAVAGSVDTTVRIPGSSRIPAPGSYVASPALTDAIDGAEGDQLAGRYGTRQVGVLPGSVLNSPDSLVVVMGVQPEQLAASGQTKLISSFAVPPTTALATSSVTRTIVALGAIGVLLPVVLLVSVVTQLGMAERQESLATLRLMGAPPAIVRRLAIIEAAVTGVVGAALGTVIATLVRPWAARISMGDGRFFPADLALSPMVVALACVAMICIVLVAATLRASRVHVGPLGVSRYQSERRPGAGRLALLAFGLTTIGVLPIGLRWGWIDDGVMASVTMITGFLATALGIMAVGPYLTYAASRWVLRHARSAEGLIAAGRIYAAPRATFRSVAGLVVAAFMVSVFAGAASAGAPEPASSEPGLMPMDAMVVAVPAKVSTSATTTVPGMVTTLGAVPGVWQTVVAYGHSGESHGNVPAGRPDATWVVPTKSMAALGFTSAPSGSYVQLNSSAYLSARSAHPVTPQPATVTDIDALQPVALVVRTDGTADTAERVRTAVEQRWLMAPLPVTRAERVAGNQGDVITELYSVAGVGVFIAIAVAGCTLAIAAIAAVLDRKRVLGTLRLMGMPVGKLRRTIAFEAAVPMVAVLAMSVGLGLAVAWFIIKSLSDRQMAMPAPQYFIALGAGLLFAIGAIAVSFTAVRANTTTSVTRFE